MTIFGGDSMQAKQYFLGAAVGMFAMAAGSAMAFHGGGVAIDVVARYGEAQLSLCNKCHVQD